MKELVEKIISGQIAEATRLFEQLLADKIQEKMEESRPDLIESTEMFDLVEALTSKMVVRGGKIRRKWTGTGGAQLSVRGKQYKAKRVQIDPKTGKRKEVNRSEAEVRKKVIDMKRRWKTTMRAKLPQLLRKRARSSNIAKNL